MNYQARLAGLITLFILAACSNTGSHPDTTTGTLLAYPDKNQRPSLPEEKLKVISSRIYFNEAAAEPQNLIKWDDKGQFIVLGIGRFTWYPQGVKQHTSHTFPAYLDYMQKNGLRIPFWLIRAKDKGAPWLNKQSFLQSQNDPQVRELRRILFHTKELQALFFYDRIHASIPEIVRQAPANKRQQMINNYNAMASTQSGWYPLIDYVNFSGTGLKSSEQYDGQGWGLAQVLQKMHPASPGSQALQEFTKAANYMLQRRLNNAPSKAEEDRLSTDWKERLSTYTRSF